MEYGVYVIWRPCEEIETMIKTEFQNQIAHHQIFEVTPEKRYQIVCQCYNLKKFNKATSKIKNNLPISIFVIKDEKPKYQIRVTQGTRTRKYVNKLIFDFKALIRKKYNSDYIHASDEVDEANWVFKAFGLDQFVLPYEMIHPDKLLANVCTHRNDKDIPVFQFMDIKNTPHYRFLLNDPADYIENTEVLYHSEFHNKDYYQKLIDTFDYQNYNSDNNRLIQCVSLKKDVAKKHPQKKYRIRDGLHRASILVKNNIYPIKVYVL